jgi:DNA polymerase-3 subunit epsilon/ATP-dependent DNA helicase DinG
MKTCVALDIESTGFDPATDQVIEIAAVKFEGEKIIDTFETFINPQIAIPPIITHITGIKNEDVENAPVLEDIQKELEEFIGDCPIVGHNIDFDVNFLKAKRVGVPGPLYDTLQLSMILLPGLPSYSLDTLGRTLKLEHENKHRAMSDTMACFKLFRILEEKIAEIKEPTLQKIRAIVQRSSWAPGEIFIHAATDLQKRQKNATNKNGLGKTKSDQHNKQESTQTAPHDTAYTQTAEKLLEAYKPGGKLSAVIPDYETRPSQQHMTELIMEALSGNRKKLIEAGTGVGKTLAYLTAAVHHSLKQHKKVVVSTYTHNLQEQLLKKDMPLLQKLFAPHEFKIALVKGRKNYLSYKRLELLMHKDSFADHEVALIVKVLLWLDRSRTGDLDELTFVGKEYSMLDEICCAEYACSHEDPEFKNSCYLMKARQNAFVADIIIVNHALLLQDLTAENPILPEYEHIVIDEAHHLEKVATDTFTVVLAFHSFQRPFEKLKKNLDVLGRFTKDAEVMNELQTIRQETEQLLNRTEIFFGLVGIFLEKNLGPYQFNQINLSETDVMSKEWLQAKNAGKIVAEASGNLLEKLTKLHESSGSFAATVWKEIKGYIYQCEKKSADLRSVLESDEESFEQMTWISKSFEENVTIRRSPVDVGPMMNTVLWNVKPGIILTSATLRTDHTFNFFRSQLGLDQSFEEAVLPSHFSYPDQVKIIIPEDLPEPATEGYFKSCASIIKNIIQANGGRTLVLFTAKKALSATYHEIAPELKKSGFTVLGQQISGGRGKILQHFKDEPATSAIFGTQSFWEGVDLQGDTLNCVVIQKLPFDPPDDPMIVARSKKYANAFSEYQLPKAILKFKQGFGRLIRSSKDTGTIVILDTRIIQKNYGHQFLEALPEGITIKYGSKDKLHELLKDGLPEGPET